jgi:hypothetical protein
VIVAPQRPGREQRHDHERSYRADEEPAAVTSSDRYVRIRLRAVRVGGFRGSLRSSRDRRRLGRDTCRRVPAIVERRKVVIRERVDGLFHISVGVADVGTALVCRVIRVRLIEGCGPHANPDGQRCASTNLGLGFGLLCENDTVVPSLVRRLVLDGRVQPVRPQPVDRRDRGLTDDIGNPTTTMNSPPLRIGPMVEPLVLDRLVGELHRAVPRC